MSKIINSILIANRGEIASRIIRTCRKMGIRSIAVFSEADRLSPFVEEADVAVHIGDPIPAHSYLNQEKILKVARQTGADAIHPGYGFLSENVGFAKKCAEEGLIFIGPNAEAIDSMGSKSKAKTLMTKHKVPVVPGYQGKDQSVKKLTAAAQEIGFPVLLKATAGGGGKGMRIVESETEIKKAIEAAKRESKSAFGDDELIVEKYIASGRHIEFQIFGDQHGNAIHILERECTIQRRYQKVVEESPSPVMTPKLRQAMGAAAVNAAKALNYDNAGTVEFIYDDKTGDFFFLEVNTRLQVEHPVTEEITGLDLVQMQIESAQGMPLRLSQDDVKGTGYAVEVRLYAEDPANDFLPVTGTIQRFDFPPVEGLRVETAIKSGSEISVYYDPMIAKIIVHDQSRASALRKMRYVLKNLICQGMTTNQDFLLKVLEQPDFEIGQYDTHFIAKQFKAADFAQSDGKDETLAAIGATLFDWYHRNSNRTLLRNMPSGWRNNYYQPQSETFILKDTELTIGYRSSLRSEFIFYVDEREHNVQLLNADNQFVSCLIDGVRYGFQISTDGQTFYVQNESVGNHTLVQKNRFPAKVIEKMQGGYETPMPSQIVKILVAEGQKVRSGEGLVVLSSMKMENTVEAMEDGIVEEIYAEEGTNVGAGVLLLKVKSAN